MKIKRNEKLTELERRKVAKKNYFIATLTVALMITFAPFAFTRFITP